MATKAYFVACVACLLVFTIPTGHAHDAEKAETIAQANNKFALDLYRKLIQSGEENVFFSPLGVSTVLSMALLGTTGRSADNIRKVLHLDELDEQKTLHEHMSYRTLLKILESEDDMTEAVYIANKLFLDDDNTALGKYEEDSLKFYGTVPETIEFGKEKETRKRINQWLRDETEDATLTDLVGADVPLNAKETKAVLVNAMLFKGTWLEKFKKGYTRDFEFHRAAGDKVMSKVMIQHQVTYKASYAFALNAQVLEIPYAGNKMTMVLVVPSRVGGLDAVEKALNYDSFEVMREDAADLTMDVFLPKFKLEATHSLKVMLQKLGLKNIFVPGNAEMSDLSANKDLAISQVLQKVALEVDEEGMLGPHEAVSPQKERFVANRPFLFFIEDNKSGAIVFMGRVTKPNMEVPKTRHDEL